MLNKLNNILKENKVDKIVHEYPQKSENNSSIGQSDFNELILKQDTLFNQKSKTSWPLIIWPRN